MKNQVSRLTIRETLQKLVNFREKQLAHKLIPTTGPNGEDRLSAARKLKTYLSHFVKKDDQAHINLLLIEGEDILALLPSKKSKFSELRFKVLHLINYALNNHTLNPKSKVLETV